MHAERSQFPLQTKWFHRWSTPEGHPWADFHRDGPAYFMRFPGLADFRISPDGEQVEGWPAPGVPQDTVMHLYLNQVVPLALNRQGKLVLHGSAIEVDGRGVAFIGASGRGKSTLAASFVLNGHKLLTDDGLVLERSGKGWLVLPSHPSIRLWQDSEAALDLCDVAKAPPAVFTSKARLLAGGLIRPAKTAQPLHRLYFLSPDDCNEPSIGPIGASNALMELVRNSFLLDVEHRDSLASHFDELSELVALGCCYWLGYPRDFGQLPGVRKAVCSHVRDGRI